MDLMIPAGYDALWTTVVVLILLAGVAVVVLVVAASVRVLRRDRPRGSGTSRGRDGADARDTSA